MNITSEYLAQHGLSETIVERFWEKVFILTYDKGCHIWLGGTDHNGYGVIYRGSQPGPMMSAHRVAWILGRGALKKGELLRHTCDEKLCVNCWHLKKGTQWDNVHDMIERGRMGRGSQRAWAKLTEEQVIELRKDRAKFGTPYSQLAQRFGIHTGTAGQIVRREKWTHV